MAEMMQDMDQMGVTAPTIEESVADVGKTW